MSYETISESRAKKLEGIFTDTSDILELKTEESQKCIDYFNKLIFNDLNKHLKGIQCWIAGGSIRDYFTKGKITNDVDLYFTNNYDFNRVFKYLEWKKTSLMSNEMVKELYWEGESKNIIFENQNCKKIKYEIKLSSDLEIIVDPNLDITEIDVDLIKIYSISPETCISNFDFTVCAAAVTTDKFIYHKNFFEDLEKKNLKSICLDPESLIYRIQKYSRMGFTFRKEELDIITRKYIKMDA